jgi:uncharacterized protein YbjT (DUF2867 family)
MSTKTIVVAGATGRFGGLVEILLERGHRVRALTRDPQPAPASRLRALGAEVWLGDFDDPRTIARAARGADALFAGGTAHRAGPESELRHGRNVAGAASEAGVRQLVYVSGDGASADSPLPLFRAKFAVEHHIGSLGIPHTILAPVYFMENLFNPWNVPALRAGVLPSPVDVARPLQQVALRDVLSLAALAIESPERFDAMRIRIASDEVSALDAVAAIAHVHGVELEPRRLRADELAPGLRALFGWLSDVGHDVDVEALHGRYPGVGWHGYSQWIAGQRPRFRELCPHRDAVAH